MWCAWPCAIPQLADVSASDWSADPNWRQGQIESTLPFSRRNRRAGAWMITRHHLGFFERYPLSTQAGPPKIAGLPLLGPDLQHMISYVASPLRPLRSMKAAHMTSSQTLAQRTRCRDPHGTAYMLASLQPVSRTSFRQWLSAKASITTS